MNVKAKDSSPSMAYGTQPAQESPKKSSPKIQEASAISATSQPLSTERTDEISLMNREIIKLVGDIEKPQSFLAQVVEIDENKEPGYRRFYKLASKPPERKPKVQPRQRAKQAREKKGISDSDGSNI